MEALLKCESIEEVKEVLKKINKDKYDAFLNDSKKKDIVFSQIDYYNSLEQSIRHHEEEIESIQKYKAKIDKQIYLLTNLYIRDIKELSHDE